MAMTPSAGGPRPGGTPDVTPRLPRRAGAVAALGLAGVAALALQPLPPDIGARIPSSAHWPALALKALLMLNPAVLVLAASLAGAVLAHRLGLRSLAAGTAPVHAWVPTLVRSAMLGLALGLALGQFDAALQPYLGEAWRRSLSANPPGAASLTLGLLYGGLAEEVMVRWGVMSVVAWALSAAMGPRRTEQATGGAVVVAAALFAVGHLPALAAQVTLTTPVVLRTLMLNGLAGIVYGWLFRRHHLEAAMAAHAFTHAGRWIGSAFVP